MGDPKLSYWEALPRSERIRMLRVWIGEIEHGAQFRWEMSQTWRNREMGYASELRTDLKYEEEQDALERRTAYRESFATRGRTAPVIGEPLND
jgi:hypothetical protein